MRLKSGLIAALVSLGVLSAGAEAKTRNVHQASVPSAAALPLGGTMRIGVVTSTPYGWVDFCRRYAGECDATALAPEPVVLNERAWALLRGLNTRVNHAIKPMSDMDHWGVIDQWDLPTDGYGDCEDYVLMKRKLLIQAGLSRTALLVTVVRDEKGEGHALLTVRTDHGDLILDNMRDTILAWDATPYQFVKRQSEIDPDVWVHRDLKPHNVFFSQAGETWKILDFGVSKMGGTGTLTKGHVVGTPAYMAPEQAKGENVDHRADVYSLAAILYRAVTGHPAFASKDVPTTLYDVVYRVPTQPSILSPLPGDVDRVLALGLAKDPADRFATALEFATWFSLAIADELTPEQRRRADELTNKHPWGTRQV